MLTQGCGSWWASINNPPYHGLLVYLHGHLPLPSFQHHESSKFWKLSSKFQKNIGRSISASVSISKTSQKGEMKVYIKNKTNRIIFLPCEFAEMQIWWQNHFLLTDLYQILVRCLLLCSPDSGLYLKLLHDVRPSTLSSSELCLLYARRSWKSQQT